MSNIYWGDNYNLANKTLTRVGRPYRDFMSSGDYVITRYGIVRLTRLYNNEGGDKNDRVVISYIENDAEFTRWIYKKYSDRYLVTVCKRFAKECHEWRSRYD